MTNSLFAPPDLGTVLLLSGLPGGSNKIHDRSPYGNIGTIVGATWVRLPSGLWCLSFDGNDDYVEVAESLAGLQNWTIKAWINCAAADADVRKTVYCEAKTDDAAQVIYFAVDNIAADYTRLFVRDDANHSITLTTGEDICDGKYHLLHAWRRGDDFKIFVDCMEKASGTQAGIGAQTFDKWTWGASYWNQVNPTTGFKGKMALMELHASALSIADMQNQRNREKHLFGVW